MHDLFLLKNEMKKRTVAYLLVFFDAANGSTKTLELFNLNFKLFCQKYY